MNFNGCLISIQLLLCHLGHMEVVEKEKWFDS